MALSGPLVLEAQYLHEVTNTKGHVLGKSAFTKDGRQYRYAKNGAVALAAGDTFIAPTVIVP